MQILRTFSSRRTSTLLLASVVIFCFACSTDIKHSDAKKAEVKKDSGPVPDEVSLKADRSKYDEIRKEIPEETKRDNDELAFIRGLMAEGSEEPSKIRDRFGKAVRDRRDKFDKNSRKSREDYNKHERINREAFLKKLKEAREEFMKSNKKIDPEKRRDFFSEQESERQDYFNDERDNRREFESTATEARRDFEAYITEKNNQFTSDMREYTTNYYERKKQGDLKKRMDEKAKEVEKKKAKESAQEGNSGDSGFSSQGKPSGPPPSPLDEFKQIPTSPGTPLGAPDPGH